MRQTPSLQTAAHKIVSELKAKGHEAYWAGGCVRDMLLGLQPSDIDIATSAHPDQIAELFPRTRKVGAQFGVMLVKQSRYWVEVATFRQDVNYTDGRRPDQVIFSSASEDAKRRDFTVNGLFYDPQSRQVIDYVDGRQDLELKTIRAIGNPAERFAEDHLRMLRAVRFAARFGFNLEPATADAIREHAAQLTRISPERVREELEKMLVHPSRARAMELAAQLGLLVYLWPDADWPPHRVHSCTAVLAAIPNTVDFVLGLAGLLSDRTATQARHIGRALRCSNSEIADLAWLVGRQEAIGNTHLCSLADFKRLAAHPRFPALLALHLAICRTQHRPIQGYEAAARLWQETPPDQIAPPPLITGDDLIDLGMAPGPAFKRILDVLYTAQLDNELTTREDALAKLSGLMAS